MKKAIIHCGLHKTGTSAIQDFLFENKQSIYEETEYKVFTTNIDGREFPKNLSTWVDHNNVNRYSATVRPLLYNSLSRYSQDDKTVIISSEAFSWLLDENEIKSFHDNLMKIFDDVIILFYLRRQDKLAISHFCQRSKSYHREGTFYQTVHNSALPILDDNAIKYLDYNKRISQFVTHFGSKNVKIRIFEREHLVGNDVVEDFKKYLGINLPHKKNVQNKAYGLEQVKFHECLINKKLKQNSIIAKVGNNIKSTRKVSCNKQEGILFYDFFKSSNIKLSETLYNRSNDLFDNDFSMYNEDYEFSWKANDVEKIIESLILTLNPLDEIINNENLKLITRLSESIKKSNPDDYERLISLSNNIKKYI